LFKDFRNKFQVGNREAPDLTLICIFRDEFFLITNWEQFLEVEPGVEEAHIRTLSDYLGWMYDDYVHVGRETAGIKRLVKIVVKLSSKEIEPLRSEFKPSLFSLAWFSNTIRLMTAVFGLVVFALIVLMILHKIKNRR
jgi:hypothetical protein